jgi:hypothetical protein
LTTTSFSFLPQSKRLVRYKYTSTLHSQSIAKIARISFPGVAYHLLARLLDAVPVFSGLELVSYAEEIIASTAKSRG